MSDADAPAGELSDQSQSRENAGQAQNSTEHTPR